MVLLGLVFRIYDLKLSYVRNDVYSEVAKALRGSGEYVETLERLEELKAEDPVNASWAEAVLAKSEGIYSVDHFESIFQDSRFIHYARAAYPEDVALASLAYQYHPENGRAVSWLADVLLVEDPERAIFYYQKATELNPTDDLNWRHLAELTEWKDPEVALEAAHKACRLNPVADGSCFREAIVAYRLGEWERCVQGYEFLTERDSILYPEHWTQFILALEELGRMDEADHWFEEAVEVAPADYGALFKQYAISGTKD
jgi:tetratricopeptide (TPR) repeat protein